MITTGLRLLDIPFLYGNIFRQVIMSNTRDLVIKGVNFCTAWSHIHISRDTWFFVSISQCS